MKRLYLIIIVFLSVIILPVVAGAQVQNALDFDGNDDLVLIGTGASVNLTNQMTLEAWIYPRNISKDWQRVICKDDQTEASSYLLGVSANGGVYFGLCKGSAQVYINGSTLLVQNAWNHIAGVWNGTVMNIYLNGILQAESATVTAPIDITTHPLRLGRTLSSNYAFDGRMDEARIWNVARTANQLRENMYRELINPASETNLVAYYQFDQTSGTTLPNLSSLSPANNGTLTNMDPTTDWVQSTAPIPYYSVASGNWNTNGTWASGQFAPANTWSRVQVKNALTVTANATAEELTIDPSSSLTVNAGIFFTVNGAITNNAGNSGLVIKADGTGSGSLINATASVPGTVETYITSNRWHFISAPIANALSGIFTTYYLQRHQEAGNYYLDISPTYVPLNVMQGYALWSGTNNTFNYAGTLNTGNQSFGLTRNSQGWNLSGNPYPSSIDWDAATGWTKTNVNNAIYVENNGGWATYIAGVGTNGGTRYIAPGQGFFVNCNSHPGTLSMNNSVRVHNNTAFFKDEVTDMVRLSVAGIEYTDEMVVRFLGDASEAFDGNYDAYKLASLDAVPELFSFAGTEELAINALPETQLVQLGFRCQEGGSYSISAAEIRDIANVVLEDKLNSTFTDLKTATYTFTYQAGDDANRFVLHFTPLNIEQQNVNPFGVYASGKNIYINSDQSVQVKVFDLLGQQVKSVAVGSGSSSIEMTQSGIYLVRIKSASQTFTTKVNIQ